MRRKTFLPFSVALLLLVFTLIDKGHQKRIEAGVSTSIYSTHDHEMVERVDHFVTTCSWKFVTNYFDLCSCPVRQSKKKQIAVMDAARFVCTAVNCDEIRAFNQTHTVLASWRRFVPFANNFLGAEPMVCS